MKVLLDCELILNSDDSVYHLGLKPEDISDTVLTVGDPDRVQMVTKNFDSIDFSKQIREFRTVSGYIGNKRITVLSTGIGTDNVDIVLNELAFLRKVDLKTRTEKSDFKSLQIIRLGTSGSISANVALDSIVYSKDAISLDDLFCYYQHSFDEIEFDNRSYAVIPCSERLENQFNKFQPSLTLTTKGFYGPQFRNGVLKSKYKLDDISHINYKNSPIGNVEMETAGIYGLSKLCGFEAISINAILADRLAGTFSKKPQQVVEEMIKETLEIICN